MNSGRLSAVDTSRQSRLIATLSLLAIAVLVWEAVVAASLGWTTEDHGVQALFRRLARTSWTGIWTQGSTSYRPLCGSVVYLQDVLQWDVRTRYLASSGLHMLNVALLAGLAARIRGVSAGLVAFGLAATWSSDAETSLWLGARCDLLVVVFGLLGAHAVLSATHSPKLRRRVGWSALAAFAALCASLAKETGWFTPLIWAPLALQAGKLRWRLLLPSVAGVGCAFVVRFWTLPSVLGGYIEHYAEPDPMLYARKVVRALGQIGLGDALPDWHSLLLIGAAVVGLALWLLWRAAPPGPARLLSFVALVAVLGPASIKVAPRTLYPVVLVLACLVGASWQRIRESHVMIFALAAFVVWQAISSAVTAREWSGGHRERSTAVALLQWYAQGQDDLLVLGPRTRFRRRPLGRPVAGEADGQAAFGYACTPKLNHHYDFASSCEGAETLLVQGQFTAVGSCRWTFRLDDYFCNERLMRHRLDGVQVRLTEDARVAEISLDRGRKINVLWLDRQGTAQHAPLACRM